MTTNLLLSGGIFHPFAETSERVAALLGGFGIHSEIRGVAEGLEALRARTFDMVTVNALAFSMTQAEKYTHLRAAHAFVPSRADRAALRDHAARGAILGLHAAAICFDEWDEWADMLGAGWVWGRSHHPMPGYVDVNGSAGRARLWDEIYCDLQIANDAQVVATGTTDGIDEPQPVLVARSGAAYFSLGHDLTGMAAPGYAPLLSQAAGLALGRERAAA